MAAKRIVIGLVGQVCAGKSAVTSAFGECGAQVFDADRCVHGLYRRPEVIAEVRRMFGADVVDGKGAIDRGALGRKVFGSAEALRRLTEEIIFPRTGPEIQKAIEAFRESPAPALILDAPTLFEAGREGLCERIVFVQAPRERRLKWAQARGWNEDELERREGMLLSEELKRKRADYIFDNAGTLADAKRTACELLSEWTRSVSE